jgi:hypothetical protein
LNKRHLHGSLSLRSVFFNEQKEDKEEQQTDEVGPLFFYQSYPKVIYCSKKVNYFQPLKGYALKGSVKVSTQDGLGKTHESREKGGSQFALLHIQQIYRPPKGRHNDKGS